MLQDVELSDAAGGAFVLWFLNSKQQQQQQDQERSQRGGLGNSTALSLFDLLNDEDDAMPAPAASAYGGGGAREGAGAGAASSSPPSPKLFTTATPNTATSSSSSSPSSSYPLDFALVSAMKPLVATHSAWPSASLPTFLKRPLTLAAPLLSLQHSFTEFFSHWKGHAGRGGAKLIWCPSAGSATLAFKPLLLNRQHRHHQAGRLSHTSFNTSSSNNSSSSSSTFAPKASVVAEEATCQVVVSTPQACVLLMFTASPTNNSSSSSSSDDDGSVSFLAMVQQLGLSPEDLFTELRALMAPQQKILLPFFSPPVSGGSSSSKSAESVSTTTESAAAAAAVVEALWSVPYRKAVAALGGKNNTLLNSLRFTLNEEYLATKGRRDTVGWLRGFAGRKRGRRVGR
jgi:hypothetical protein